MEEKDIKELLNKAKSKKLTSEEKLKLLQMMNEAVMQFRIGLRNFRLRIAQKK